MRTSQNKIYYCLYWAGYPLVLLSLLFCAYFLLIFKTGLVQAQVVSSSPSPKPASLISMDTRISAREIGLNDTFVLEVIFQKKGVEAGLDIPCPDLRTNDKLELIGNSCANSGWEQDGQFIQEKRYTFTFTGKKAGLGVIEPIRIEYTKSGEAGQAGAEKQILSSAGFEVQVSRLHLDLSQRVRKIIALAALVLLMMMVITPLAICWGLSRQRKKINSLLSSIKQPSMEEQYLALFRETVQLRKSGDLREYHDRLASLLKRYLAQKYQTNTMEKTTPIILEQLTKMAVDENQLRCIDEILSISDRVKFAKYQPGSEEMDRILKMLEDLILGGGAKGGV